MPPPPPQWQQLIPPQQQWQRPPMPVQPSLWEQQLPPPSGQPFSSQPPYGVSPSPDFGQSQQPKKRSRRWVLAVLGGIVALSCLGSSIFVALNSGSSRLGSDLPGLLIVVFLFIEVPILRRIVDDYIREHGDLVGGRIIKHHQKENEDGFP